MRWSENTTCPACISTGCVFRAGDGSLAVRRCPTCGLSWARIEASYLAPSLDDTVIDEPTDADLQQIEAAEAAGAMAVELTTEGRAILAEVSGAFEELSPTLAGVAALFSADTGSSAVA